MEEKRGEREKERNHTGAVAPDPFAHYETPRAVADNGGDADSGVGG